MKLTTKLVPLLFGQTIMALTIWPFILVSPNYYFSEITESHERIHLRQQLEMLIIFFYLWYLIEWLIKFLKYKDANTAYFAISLEQEAYLNEKDAEYHRNRKLFSWVKYF